ncbi:hypothetical protein ACFL6T_02950 [Candidatus Zixiibacteriota bacterium]
MATPTYRTTERESLSDLMHIDGPIPLLRIWHSLTYDEKIPSLKILFTLKDHADKAVSLILEIARLKNFRHQTVAGWSPGKKAEAAVKLTRIDNETVHQLLVCLHLPARHQMLGAFLDDLGVGHTDGALKDEMTAPPASVEDLYAAADRLLLDYPKRHVVLYIMTIIQMFPDALNGLRSWVRAHAGLLDEDTPAESRRGDTEESTDSEELAGVSEDRPDEFTTLDKRMVDVIIDVAQGIEGAPDIDELDDLVEELVHLNSKRYRSFFHAGFRDAVLSRGLPEKLAADNAIRRRWYYAGYIQGLVRQSASDEVLNLYDKEVVVRNLGDTGLDASSAAAQLVCRVLLGNDRATEAMKFLKTKALINLDPTFLYELFEYGTILLRQEQAREAKEVFNKLQSAVDIFKNTGIDVPIPFQSDLQRRRAHCERLLGQFSEADRILTGLLQSESSRGQASILTDLGLMEGGFRRLSDVVLPLNSDEKGAFSSALEKGEVRYREALKCADQSVGHPRYCLGVLAICREEWQEAEDHLDEAVIEFQRNPGAYSHGDLHLRSKLYLAISICNTLHSERISRAADLIRQSCNKGICIPNYLVESTVAALAAYKRDLADETVTAILDTADNATLDILKKSEVASDSQPVASALLCRFRKSSRSRTKRAQDCLTVLPLLINQERIEEAEEVLDFLDESAEEGTLVDEFIDLILEPSRCEPAWDAEDCRWAGVRVFEGAGRYREALPLLEEAFHRVLSEAGYGALEDADALLDRIKGFGLPDKEYKHLIKRFEALRSDSEEKPERISSPGPVHVLVAGGNETQARYDDRIHKELAEQYPAISVEFFHTGWSSNWMPMFEQIMQHQKEADAVVIISLIRTNLGRKIRANCEVPWRTCGGSGKKAIMNSILNAAAAVSERQRSG